jgi:HSP20 family protein
MALNKVSTSLQFLRRQPARADASADSYWVPNTDVYLKDAGLVIKVELAGMRREDLELTIEGSQLKISGHRPDGCRAAKCQFLVMEISYGAFESYIEIPPGYDLDRAQASYQNGFLRVDVPENEPPSQKERVVPIVSG